MTTDVSLYFYSDLWVIVTSILNLRKVGVDLSRFYKS